MKLEWFQGLFTELHTNGCLSVMFNSTRDHAIFCTDRMTRKTKRNFCFRCESGYRGTGTG